MRLQLADQNFILALSRKGNKFFPIKIKNMSRIFSYGFKRFLK